MSSTQRIAFVVFIVCAGWLATVAILRQTTNRLVPTINVRWVSGTSRAQQAKAAEELSLLLREERDTGTGNYFLLDTRQEAVKRIVLHPFVEDTAFLDRGAFSLENAPLAGIWIGNTLPVFGSPGLIALCILGCLTGGVFALPVVLHSPP